MENNETQKSKNEVVTANFTVPSWEEEIGEIERTAEHFGLEKQYFLKEFLDKYTDSQLEELSEENWKNLENTDSYNISVGDWDIVGQHAEHSGRDWNKIKTAMESGDKIFAPIILKKDGKLHLVSGNTRLMVSRALGIKPKVLIVSL